MLDFIDLPHMLKTGGNWMKYMALNYFEIEKVDENWIDPKFVNLQTKSSRGRRVWGL